MTANSEGKVSIPQPALVERHTELLKQVDRLWKEQESVPLGKIPVLGTIMRSLKRLLFLGEFESLQKQLVVLASDRLTAELQHAQEAVQALTTYVNLLTADLRHTQESLQSLTTHVNSLTADLRHTQEAQESLARHLDLLTRSGSPSDEVERLRHELSYLPVSINLVLKEMSDRIDQLAKMSAKRDPDKPDQSPGSISS